MYLISAVCIMAANEATIRLAAKSDLSAVWEMSNGLYGGLDTLPYTFLHMLDDPQHTVLVVVKDGKAVGLRVIHIIENGETAIFEGLRVHAAYRGQGIAKQIMKASEQYVREHFPGVKVIRYSVSTRDKSRLALQVKYDDRVSFKLAICACFVDPSKTASILQQYVIAFKSTNVKEVNIKDINMHLKSHIKLDHVLFHNNFFVTFAPLKAVVSNIDHGLINDEQNFFASITDNGAVKSFSQSHRTVAVKCPRWCVTLYTMDENLLEIHLVNHLIKAMKQDTEDTFAFVCFFRVPLLKRVSNFLLHELALKNIDSYCEDGHLFVSSFERNLSTQ